MTGSDHALDAQWRELAETEQPGSFRRRLSEDLPIYVTSTNPGRLPGLSVRVDFMPNLSDRELHGSESFAIEIEPEGGDVAVSVRALSDDGATIFLPFARDLVDRMLAHDTAEGAAVALIRGFNWWQRSLKVRRSDALSKQRQLGLFGELSTLEDLMIPIVGVDRAVHGWTGPDDAPQDFQIDRAAVEVKTLAHSEPQQMRIDGERQLDDLGLDLLLIAHHQVVKHEGSGTTLPEKVDALRRAVAEHPVAAQRLEELLGDYGYWDEHASQHYASTGYTVRSTSYYRVVPGFPRITPPDLQTGLGGVTYLIDASACDVYRVADEQIRAWLAEPSSAVDPTVVGESRIVEYKQTAWTPVGETRNDEHRQSVARELRTAVIKTVVAFLNSDGGELVIGVADDLSVSGIEADLRSAGRNEKDLDWYQRELLTMLIGHIDETVSRRIRITFDVHDDGTACHVAVAPSSRPVFGRTYAKGGKGELHFWTRAENTTRPLEGRALVEYIDDHFRGAPR